MELACGVTAQVVRLKGDGWGGVLNNPVMSAIAYVIA